MSIQHVIDIIDSKSPRDLTQDELNRIELHVSQCGRCKESFAAARLVELLMEARTAGSEVCSPSPFFAGKVMSAIREGRARRQAALFRNWWSASFSLVVSMLMIVFCLAAAALLLPSSGTDMSGTGGEVLTPDTVIIGDRMPREFTNEQALQEIYSSRTEVKK